MIKLFVPGPTYVRPEILMAQTAPMIGHRSKEYSDLQRSVTGKLQELLYTSQRVYLFTSASSGVMEGSIRQASKQRMLVTVCGAFSKRWHEIVVANGVPCDKLEVPSGQAITPDLVEAAMQKNDYDAITLTLNETATGILNPVREIAGMLQRQYPNTLILVDAVSAMAGVKIEFDAWGIDVVFAGVQKCFALPPGLTVCAVSDRARARALEIPNRGFYFAYDAMDKNYDKFQTPATPAISLIQALDRQLDDIFLEGLEARFSRHLAMASHVREWARHYFRLYGDERYLSPTVTNIENTRGVNISNLNKELARRNAQISGGYGDLKDKCFRIGHMGDLSVADVQWLTLQLNEILNLG
jgi:aspartate aminotransferase-like enzyme